MRTINAAQTSTRWIVLKKQQKVSKLFGFWKKATKNQYQRVLISAMTAAPKHKNWVPQKLYKKGRDEKTETNSRLQFRDTETKGCEAPTSI